MVPFRFLLLSAVVAAVLAAIGVTAVMTALNPSSRAITAACENRPPSSTTTAPTIDRTML